MLGKEHSIESKLKMSKSQSDKNNSQYGTCWIYHIDLKENKKIQKLEIDAWILEGWIKGRKSFSNVHNDTLK